MSYVSVVLFNLSKVDWRNFAREFSDFKLDLGNSSLRFLVFSPLMRFNISVFVENWKTESLSSWKYEEYNKTCISLSILFWFCFNFASSDCYYCMFFDHFVHFVRMNVSYECILNLKLTAFSLFRQFEITSRVGKIILSPLKLG